MYSKIPYNYISKFCVFSEHFSVPATEIVRTHIQFLIIKVEGHTSSFNIFTGNDFSNLFLYILVLQTVIRI